MADNEIVGEQVKIKAERVANPLMWVGDGEPDAYAAFKMESQNAQDKKDLAVVLALQDVLAIHSEFKIYEECECAERDEEGHLLSDPQWSEFVFCAKSFMYLICLECCTDGEDTEMTEWCADHHDHGEGKPICKTHQVIHNRLGGMK